MTMDARDHTPRGALRRAVRLAGLPAGHAGRVAVGVGRRLGGQPAEAVVDEVRARSAEHLFRTLGELKGGAMKFGQALSAMEAVMPAELAAPYRDALIRLQEAAPPMPRSTVHQVLTGELGEDWPRRFQAFDDRPAAAASIGQVHRATWHDGRDVAVKVQYPGAGDALTADIRQLHRFVPLVRLGAAALDARQLFEQLQDRLVEELDYRHEAAVQRSFADGYADDDHIAVPDVVHAGSRVLVTEWMEGRPLASVIADGTAAERNATGRSLLRLLLSSPSKTGLIHGDPHPGNFKVLADGRLGVLDFGSSEPMPAGWPRRFGALLHAGQRSDAGALHHEAVAAGLITPDVITPRELLAVLDPWLGILRHDDFHFERSWLQGEVRKWSDPRSAGSRLQRRTQIPVRHLLVQRVAFGLLGVLTSLDATIPVRGEVERWVPGAGDRHD